GDHAVTGWRSVCTVFPTLPQPPLDCLDILTVPDLQERDGGHRPGEALQREIPHRLDVDELLDRRDDALGSEHLAGPSLAAEAEREVRHAADRPVVEPPLEADRADRREALGEAEAHVEVV